MKKKLLFISLVLLFGLVFSGAVSAADVYVNTTGNDATGTGTINNPYLSVSKGVSKVSNGGTVYIADGVYSGANNRGITINKNMTIRGQSEAGTIIDAQKLNRIFTIQTSYTVNMFNLTLRNGNVTNLGGSIENNGNLKLTHCTITNNYGGVSGGAIINNNMASLTVTDCTFNKNSVNFDEGNGGAIINHNLLTVTGSSFSQNSASCGGAIFTSDNGNSILNNCIFTDNVAQSSGGAVFNVVGTTTINNCAFNNNTALVEVGGAILNFGKVNIVNSIFNGNTADSGGAIFTDGFDDDTLIVTGSIFTNNVAKINPGGYGYGGAIFTSIGTLNFNAFFNNTAYSGNALYASDFPVNAVKNWWGSNDSPAGDICGPVNYSQWIVMQLSALPTIISPGETSTVTANFNRVNGGGILTGGHIPDGLGVLFISDHKGSVNPSLALTLNGVAITTYTAGFVEGGYSIVNATLHGQTVNTTIIIPNPVDLIPSNLVVPSNPYTMHNYKVYVDVTNDGTDATPNGFHVILQDNGNTVDEKWIAALAAKTTIYGLAFDWKPTSPGSHFLEVLVDPYSEVIEFDETNNAINTTRNVFTITQLIVNPVNCYTNDQVTLTAKLMDTAYNVPLSGKTINFKVNNVFVNSAVTDANGIASLAYTVTFLPNTYTIFGEFVQDSLYLGSDDTDNLNVRFTPTNITVNQVEGYWNDTVNLQATLTDTGHNRPLQNKEVNFKVNGNNIGSVFTNSQGIATLPYQIPLNTGNYPIVVTFTQDLIYLGTTNTTTLTVKSTPTKITITPKEGYWNDTIQITATLTDTHNNKPLQNKEIHFKINGNPIASIFTNTQGTATLPYQIPLNTGNYPIIVTFTTDQIYTGTTNTTTLTVKSTPTKITINPATGYWNDTITITATLTDTAPGHNNKPLQGKTIHFTIQGDPNTYHTITNATGTATLQYTITQNTGPYTITTTHDTDQIYTGTTNTTTLTVKSTPTKIVVSPVSGYNHDIVSLTASFKDTIHNKPLENKIIQFFVNNNPEGFATTTSDGIATLSYTINLAAGNYTIFAKFSGDDIYTTSNGTNNLNVILVVTSVNPANGTTTTNASQIITVTFNGLIESGSDYNTITVKNSAGTTQSINKTINGTQL
ncbi:Ig-like domain repeat protein, partial [Methanobacterium sp. MZD130B]